MGTLNFVVQNKNWKFACFVCAYADGVEFMKIPIDRFGDSLTNDLAEKVVSDMLSGRRFK